jgi:hypothetical protein
VEPSPEAAVTLPGGLLLDDGRLLRHAVLRPPTGHEEEWLALHPGIPNPSAVTAVITACLVALEGATVDCDLVRRLAVGDRDVLMLQLRRLSLGDVVQAVVTCPACEAPMDVDFAVSQIDVEPRPLGESTFTVDMPRAGRMPRRVQFRVPTGADQEAVGERGDVDPVELLLERCLVGEHPDRLDERERDLVINAIEVHAPDVDLQLDLTCPDCDELFVLPFDTTAFVLAELRRIGRRVIEEIHLLALHYHWAEADILGMSGPRRRRYLALLGDQVGAVAVG